MSVQELEAEVEIDWEAKFLAQVADGIKTKAVCSTKLKDAQLELDKANGKIKTLEKQVKALEPAKTKLDKLAADARAADVKWSEKVAALNTEISELKKAQGRGHRQVLEDVIAWIQVKADKLPEPIREPEIDLDPPVSGVFE